MSADGSVRALGYVRMSLDERYHTGAGMAAQRSTIVAECEHRGWGLVEIVEDLGFSGRDLNRPGMRDAIGRLDGGEADCLVVAKLDRLSRSLLDFATLSDHARRSGWGLVALDIAVDTTTPAGEAMANVLATFAQFERRMIGQRIREARAQLRAQSRVYGTTPFGFRREGKMLVRDPAEQKIVARARRLYARGVSYMRIAERFDAEGLRGRLGGRWDGITIKSMLRANELVGCPIDRIPPERKQAHIYPVPYGYLVRSGALVEDDREQAVIRGMRRMYVGGMGWHRIADQLNGERVPTKCGGRWWPTTVANYVYGKGAIRAHERAARSLPLPVLPEVERPPAIHPVPYGYIAKRSRLVVNRREQAVLARMRQMQADGAGLGRIANQLNADRVPTRKGGRWKKGTLHGILNGKGGYQTARDYKPTRPAVESPREAGVVSVVGDAPPGARSLRWPPTQSLRSRATLCGGGAGRLRRRAPSPAPAPSRRPRVVRRRLSRRARCRLRH
jgi:DNA invertase Pin-like site-specific DNA recombinase